MNEPMRKDARLPGYLGGGEVEVFTDKTPYRTDVGMTAYSYISVLGERATVVIIEVDGELRPLVVPTQDLHFYDRGEE